ncbi:MAG: GNAT family N-acetyltransferase [Acidobacteriaceae bacterium]
MSSEGNFLAVHNADRQRFEILEDGSLAVLDYRMSHGAMMLTHTGVPREIEGRGVGGALVKAAFDHAQAQGLKVKPLCPFARKWIQRHPEYAGMVE